MSSQAVQDRLSGGVEKPARQMNWTILRHLVEAWWRDRGQFSRTKIPPSVRSAAITACSSASAGRPARDVRCLQCGSRERHRLTHLWVTEGGRDKLAGKRILHFAPEKTVMRQMRGNPLYETADLHQEGVTHRLDITRTGLPDASYDVVMAHHVLEHIDDDRQAMSELFRLLRPGGIRHFQRADQPDATADLRESGNHRSGPPFRAFRRRGPQAVLRA